ncbi:MAG: zinc ABC transporter substrate-binding protein [Chloroflexi bacterium]|nr:zinc ABC transporter substrate-binding protein [Chloroflexota bacterium]
MRLGIRSVASIAMILLALAAFVACGEDADDEGLSVVASIYPLGYFTERIGGEQVAVTVLVKPGVEAHGFEPTASDLRTIGAADLVVMNGLELEPWLERALEALEDSDTRVVLEAADQSLAIEGLPHDDHGHGEHEEGEHHEGEGEEHEHEEGEHKEGEGEEHEHEEGEHKEGEGEGHEHEEGEHKEGEGEGHEHEEGEHKEGEGEGHEHEEGEHHEEEGEEHEHEGDAHEDEGHHHGEELDPHMWLDPVLAVVQVERIRDALINADADNADVFRENAAALISELNALHAEFSQALANCRHDHFVTSHAAYGYLAARYAVEQIPIAGLSLEAEPSPQRLAEITDQVIDLGLGYVLVEPVVAGTLEETIQRETGIELIPIHAIESVTQAELDAHDDYFGLMRDNLASLKLALECA